MRVEYLIISIIIVVVVLLVLVTFAQNIFPSVPKAVSDFLSNIGAK